MSWFQRARFKPFRARLCTAFRVSLAGHFRTYRVGRPMVRKQKVVSRGLRYDAELDKRIEAATKKGGFSSPSAFMREAIERELAGRESGVDAAEQRIAASLGSHGARNSQSADRAAGVIRVRRRARQDVLDLCSGTAQGCARPGRRSRQDAVRQVSQKCWHGDGGRFAGRHGGAVRPWSRKLRRKARIGCQPPPTSRKKGV